MNTNTTQAVTDADFDALWMLFARYESRYNKVGDQAALDERRAAIESWLADFAQSRAQDAATVAVGAVPMEELDAVTVALTGDEGDDDSLTVLRRLVTTLNGRTVLDLLDYIDELKRPVGAEPNLFEFWWAEYMPTATQARAWEAFQAAPRAHNVGIAAPEANPENSGSGATCGGSDTNIAPEHYQRLSDLSDEAVARFKADAADGPRYRWLRELPNADSLNIKYCGSDLDNVVDAEILSSAPPDSTGEVKA